MRIVIDEDLPRSLGRKLQEEGYDILDIRDHGLRGEKDNVIFQFAQKNFAVLLTGDLGFGNILKFPLGKHNGIVIAHYPNEMPTTEITNQIVSNMKVIKPDEYYGNLIIMEPHRIRIRRPPA